MPFVLNAGTGAGDPRRVRIIRAGRPRHRVRRMARVRAAPLTGNGGLCYDVYV